ncbi:hypothetical protein EW093_10290 [Thiospirochaeta perfilievii]|uniref:Uncharacterized protein n=1 Tax=Thiospirochaeta perfilievii TaxID=252967 RepID=A0A5C1QFU3_9SPIO|nr:hypothetical protein [Thiospirochaeta perfilievii]QEN05082.1 hypothetical protein EW093_10290 [Thiospirochaeta perfilievii]
MLKRSISKFKVALNMFKQELSVMRFSKKYKVSRREALEFKKWCYEVYYYQSYKTSDSYSL